MTDHTPGPWDIVFRADVERIRLNGSSVYQVADTTDPDFPTGKPRYNLADLRLMAAAPELLAALKDAYDALDYAQAQVDSDTDRMHLTRCRRKIQPIIAKAEGRSDT